MKNKMNDTRETRVSLIPYGIMTEQRYISNILQGVGTIGFYGEKCGINQN